jgi:hypothetical protein
VAAPVNQTAVKTAHGAANGAHNAAPPLRKINVKRPLPSNAPVAKHGSATAPKFGRFKVGDEVMVRSGGKLWWRGKVTMVHRDKQFNGYYRVETLTGLDDYWYTQVAGLQREPYWTKFFVGTWEVRVPMAANVVTSGNSAYRVYSGGMKLPPLKINGNGTYTWALLNKKTIHGRWKPRPDAPGFILLKGEYGADRSLYNASDKSTRQVFERDVIYLTTEKHTYQEAYRAK